MISMFVGAENITLTQAQKDAFRATFAALGPPSHQQTSEIMHWRSRLDGDAVIMRAMFNDSDLTTNGLRQLLATALGVPPAQITAAQTSTTYATIPSTVLTMSNNAVACMRFILFGGIRVSVQQSNVEAMAYLKQNAALWGDG